MLHTVGHVVHPVRPLAAWPDDDHRTRLVFIARGMTAAARLELAARLWAETRRGFRVLPDRSVAAHYAGLPRDAVEGILAPLCVAALNTLPEEASAAVFGRVLAATLAGRRAASDFLIRFCGLQKVRAGASISEQFVGTQFALGDRR